MRKMLFSIILFLGLFLVGSNIKGGQVDAKYEENGIVFEDLGDTRFKNVIPSTNKIMLNFGQVSSLKNGFAVQMTRHFGGYAEIGLYNTVFLNAWQGGYILQIEPRETVRFRLGVNQNGTTDIVGLEHVNVGSQPYTITAWLTDLDETTGRHTIHLAVNGEEIITYKSENETHKIDRYLTAYSALSEPTEFRALQHLDDSQISSDPDYYGTPQNESVQPDPEEDRQPIIDESPIVVPEEDTPSDVTEEDTKDDDVDTEQSEQKVTKIAADKTPLYILGAVIAVVYVVVVVLVVLNILKKKKMKKTEVIEEVENSDN